ncbi:hypothetical protein [Actinoplanes sichuanensis]|uniref:Uncharacterized protein n=1 Tax=Actinoplanes sichuanensis TaxID=512349 RepID=A0ABW4AI73_9ACTN|nr:hypothetical protein [Actinoplanes sichuanensis]
MTIAVQLIPDRNNRHDRNAVGVWSGNSLLGHLPRPEAARYTAVLSALHDRGLLPEVNARITGREWGAADGRPAAFDGTIRLDLAEPHMLVPVNAAPAQEHRLLPSGSAVQVVGQQQALDVLVPLLRPEGECWVYVTLHEMADHLVEVRIGDARVGDLSPKMSGELSPVLRHLAERGLVTAARAVVKGNRGKTEVMLYIARVQDLPESWQAGPSRPATAPSAGRGTASVPAPGVASTGPVTPGPTPVSPSPPLPPSSPLASPPLASPPLASPPLAPVAAGASAVPGMSMPGGLMTGGPASGGLVPNWVTPADALPSWASPPSAMPAVAPLPPSTLPVNPVSPGVPAPATGSPAVPPAAPGSPAVPPAWNNASPPPGAPAVAPAWNNVSPPAWNAGSYATPYVSGSRFEPPATTPVHQTEGPGSLLTDPSTGARPVSPAPPAYSEAQYSEAQYSEAQEQLAIAETTVIPALAAVVKANSGALAGPTPVSAAPAEGNQHPPIPSAPTGIRFVVPPGWPLPPDGWYPPDGWRPDPAWPLAPAGWSWWVPAWD